MEDDEANETIFDSHAGPGDADGLRGRHRAGGAGGDAAAPAPAPEDGTAPPAPTIEVAAESSAPDPWALWDGERLFYVGNDGLHRRGGRAGHGRGCGGKPAVPGPVQAGGRAPAVDQTPDLCAGGRRSPRSCPPGCSPTTRTWACTTSSSRMRRRKRAAPGGKRQQPALCERNAAGLRGDARGPSAAAGGSCGGGACKRSRASTCRTSC